MNPILAAAIDEARASQRYGLPDSARLVGLGWATVDLERAAHDFGMDVRDADPDSVLGARCQMSVEPGDVVVVLLEPSTEGRLAATLVRRDEGPHVTWWDVDDPADLAPVPVDGPRNGPFGEARLVRDASPDGPWRFLRARPPVTIRT